MEELEKMLQNTNADEIIEALKKKRNADPVDVEAAKKALDPEKHDIMDTVKRPDKKVKVDAEDNNEDVDEKKSATKIEPVARVRLAIQKLIIRRAVAFLFGNPVTYSADPDNSKQEEILTALRKILVDIKSNSLNRKIARAMFGYKEAAELWYSTPKDHSKYGFKSKIRLRCRILSPAFGDTLYPYFDEYGDMVAFSREFVRSEDGKDVRYFETYTDTERRMWTSKDGGWELMEGFPKPVAIGKIPVVWGRQEEFETQDVDSLIDRLEKLLSNFADTNDYHASPKIFVTGEIKGWAKKGESGAVIEGDDGATMEYVSWQSAPESVKLEIETILRMIWALTQTPDISFESVKGIGSVSGIALKLMFMDAHLKVQDKKEIFDDYLQRRVNIIKAFIGEMKNDLKSELDEFEIEPEITPYMLTSEIDELNYWLTANGNKPVIDHESSIEKAGVSKNPGETYKRIQEEQSAELSFELQEPVEA